MLVVVKVGTQSILSHEGVPLSATLESLTAQLSTLMEKGHHVILVSSGAVSRGRGISKHKLGRTYGASLGEKQVLASLGQHDLMALYGTLFSKCGILVSQLLLTKHDFKTRLHYLNIARLLREIMDHKNIIPIINENDSVAVEELMFTDNDEIAGLIAAQMNADKLIILSNIEGVYTDHPNAPNAKIISVIDPNREWLEVSTTKSTHGRGGMLSKLGTARKVSHLGITSHIANIDQPQVIERIIAGEQVGTTILPLRKKSNLKRWLAYNTGRPDGTISVNSCLLEILRANQKVISILPVGITACSGQFKKGDVVDILSPDGTKIGIGLAQYDVQKLSNYIGQKDMPEFIHYDHLLMF